MKRTFLSFAGAAVFLVAAALSVSAQTVPQWLGPYVVGDFAMQAGNGQLMDAGGATNTTLVGARPNGLGIVNSGLGICGFNGYASAAYNSICLGFDASGNPQLNVSHAGGAAPTFSISVNGQITTFPLNIATIIGSAAANTVAAGPTSGASGTPSFRALVGADLPLPSATSLGGIESIAPPAHQFLTGISAAGIPSAAQPAASDISGLAASATTDTTVATNVTAGVFAPARLPLFSNTANGAVAASGGGTTNFLRADGTWQPISGSAGGTVTTLSVGNLSPLFTSSVATPTSTPAVTFSLSTATANTFLAGPTSGTAAGPTYRSIAGADLPTPSASTLGGVESGAASTSQVMNGISTAGVPQFGAVPAGALPAGAATLQTFTTQTNNTGVPKAAVVVSFVPERSGNVMIGWSGVGQNTNSADTIRVQIYLGTTALTVGNSCAADTALSGTSQLNSVLNTATTPFGGSVANLGLTLGTTYYAAVCFWVPDAGTASMTQGQISVMEQ